MASDFCDAETNTSNAEEIKNHREQKFEGDANK